MSIAESEATTLQAATRPPFYRDATIVKWIVQVVVLLGVIAAFLFFWRVAGANLAEKDISTSYDFLSIDPGISLSEGIDTEPDTGGRALWVGMVNTLRLAVTGIIFATILGILVGLARLSNNWILNRLGTVFVETLRNIPLLVQILIYAAVLSTISPIRTDTGPINGWLHISNKGISIPRVSLADGFYQWAVVMLIGAVVARWLFNVRTRQQEQTGAATYPVGAALGVLAAFGLVGLLIHPIFGWLDAPLALIADTIDKVPQLALQLVLAAAAVGFAANWIRNFLDSHRTPAGLAKLTDDDIFRMIFAGIAGLVGVVFFMIIWPGFSDWALNSSRDLFNVLSDKFGEGRGSIRDDLPFAFDRPDIEQRGNFPNPGPAGWNMSANFAAVFFGVWFYTAAFIAEIVRGGILAVAKGQSEAADAVGLRTSTKLRRIILPQAFRIILPPLGNQYLNLTKNTSLAIAVGMSDMVQVAQTVQNQTGRTIPGLVITMAFYLILSLTISVIVNFFNIRLKIVER